MISDDTFARLRTVSPLFASLEEATIRTMFADARSLRVEKGRSLADEEGTEWFNVLLEGRVKLQLHDPLSGRTFTPFLLGPGDVFDLIALLDGSPHEIFPVAVEACSLLRLPMEEAREWLRHSPAFSEALFPYLGREMRHLESLAASVIFDDTATRLARLILRHARPLPGETPLLAVEHLSHELLAEMIGSVRSVVTTQLKKLREEGAIQHRRGRILVRDLERLLQRLER
jgi:CRP-like cAMP-binding protein